MKRKIILLSIIFSICSCFFAYAYWTDKLKLKLDMRINYPVQIVVLEDESEEGQEEFSSEESTEAGQIEQEQVEQQPTQQIQQPVQQEAETKPAVETKPAAEVSVNVEAE